MLVACPRSACSRASGLRRTPPDGLGAQSMAEVSTTSRQEKSILRLTGPAEERTAARSPTSCIPGRGNGPLESRDQVGIGVRARYHRHVARPEFAAVHPADCNRRDVAAGLALDEPRSEE